MPEYCTCGAQLPPDALFCHKCGKPQRDITPVEPEPIPQPTFQLPNPQAAVPPPVAPPVIPVLSFRNPVALRIGMLVALSATVLMGFLPFLNWLAAGFFSVFFYRRKTGSLLNVGAGMRLGWITGLLAFLLAAITSLAIQLPAALSGQLATTFEQQMKAFPIEDPQMVQQLTHFLSTGPGIATMLAGSLVALFIFVTFLSMAGGALGAKLVGGSRPASR
jgi:hypothetical protein